MSHDNDINALGEEQASLATGVSLFQLRQWGREDLIFKNITTTVIEYVMIPANTDKNPT